jgi:hypothetical protein
VSAWTAEIARRSPGNREPRPDHQKCMRQTVCIARDIRRILGISHVQTTT